MKIAAREGPFERFRGSLIAVLESGQAPPERAEVWKIAWREQLALDDGEVNLDLVQPTGMDWRMNQNGIGPFDSEAVGRPRPAMGGAIVRDKEHAVRGTIRFFSHDLRDKTLERGNASLTLAAPEQPGTMHVPGGEISQCAGPRVFMLDAERTPGGGSQ